MFLYLSMEALREQTAREDAAIKKKLMEQSPKASYGYGGKFGVQNDRMDKVRPSLHLWQSAAGILIEVFFCRSAQSAVGHDYVAKVEKHESQTDASKGFGGKFGVQKDRMDKVSFAF